MLHVNGWVESRKWFRCWKNTYYFTLYKILRLKLKICPNIWLIFCTKYFLNKRWKKEEGWTVFLDLKSNESKDNREKISTCLFVHWLDGRRKVHPPLNDETLLFTAGGSMGPFGWQFSGATSPDRPEDPSNERSGDTPSWNRQKTI